MPAEESAARGAIRIRVGADASTGGPYDVLIRSGLLAASGGLITSAVAAHRCAIIADRNVAGTHARAIADSLRSVGAATDVLTFPPGEASKTRSVWAALTDDLLALGYGRDSCIVAVGGGVAGDLAGFVAATYTRGIPFINVPTSLLAMLDSSVGGKTGVDTPAGKNLVGAFHQPRLVIIDPAVLSTLSEAAFRASIAEAVKHGVVADRDYFAWIEANADAITSRDSTALTELVRRSVEIKAEVVQADTREAGVRAILNFGHTLGHALERCTDFAMAHGFAVAIGMVLEARLGEALGVTERGTSAAITSLLEAFDLPVALPPDAPLPAAIIEATRSDKKARGQAVRYALPAGLGSMHQGADDGWTLEVADDVVGGVINGARSAISQAGTEF